MSDERTLPLDDVTSTGPRQVATELVRLLGRSIDASAKVSQSVDRLTERVDEGQRAAKEARETEARERLELLEAVKAQTEAQGKLTGQVEGLMRALVDRIPAATDAETKKEIGQAWAGFLREATRFLAYAAAGGGAAYGVSQWLP